VEKFLAIGWLGDVSLVLLIIAILMPRDGQRAVLLIIGATLGIVASIFVLERPSYALLCSLIIVAILLKVAINAYQRVDVRFSDEDKMLRDAHLSAMDPALARRLIDEGHWISGQKGDVLVEEAQAAPCLFYLATGNATVSRDGIDVGRCSAGDLVGEATAVEGGAASGTVRLSTNARLWFVPAERLRAFLTANPSANSALQQGFARALRSKLDAANARAAAGGIE
jgi:CRP/FNR family transcriptional regulator, cyclic AMP receptor protein